MYRYIFIYMAMKRVALMRPFKWALSDHIKYIDMAMRRVALMRPFKWALSDL